MAIEWHGEKMLPTKLPELIYKLIPAQIAREGVKIISHPKKGDTKYPVLGCIRYPESDLDIYTIDLYPTVIIHEADRIPFSGTRHCNFWTYFLDVMLHEIGHAVTYENVGLPGVENYHRSHEARSIIERKAEEWKDNIFEKVKSRDPRAGQPEGWIGGLPGIYMLKELKSYKSGHSLSSSLTNARINCYRSYKCKGQYTLSDVVYETLSHFCKYDVRVRDSEKVRRLAKIECQKIGINRFHKDKAGRMHRYFNHREKETLKQALAEKIIEKNLFTPIRSIACQPTSNED